MVVSQADILQLREEIAVLRRDLDDVRRHLHTSAAPRDRVDNRAAAEQYAARVSRLPQVHQVLLDPRGDVPQVWTLIRAKPFDSAPRHQVYDVELEVLTAFPDARVNFRLINLKEYRGGRAEGLVPTDVQVLFRR